MKDYTKNRTLGELRRSGYTSRSIRSEMRENLIARLQKNEPVFEGVYGYEDTVLPDLERAILSRHNILLLGLKGQAKTRIARLLTTLLDDFIPVIDGLDIPEDPFRPISAQAQSLVKEKGDETPITWVSKTSRYVEKLATPDVSVADLIGDIDPIKAAMMKLPYSDYRVIHYGLIPRAHRSIFVLNELPDLQPRIQVSLFNILQEGDIQIRGYKLRLPLDVLFVFTANPDDYTNRGSIITPLKDRIESQILTHYPRSLEIAKKITLQEALISDKQTKNVVVPDLIHNILERIAFEARQSDLIDQSSGVSARMSITAYQNLVSTVERRILKNGEQSGVARMLDFWGIIPAITGKMELVYEGEQIGHYGVSLELIGNAILEEFLEHFPHPDSSDGREEDDVYQMIRIWFNVGNVLELDLNETQEDFEDKIHTIAGMDEFLEKFEIPLQDYILYKELIVFALAELDVISKEALANKYSFRDVLANMFDDLKDN